MIPILYRGHIFSFCKESDEVGLVVETAVITYFRRAQGGVGEQFACLCDPEVVHVCDE
jgi:hypothetical protein